MAQSIGFERGDELVETIETTAFGFGNPIPDGARCRFWALFRVDDWVSFTL
jgi:hypothetical protein